MRLGAQKLEQEALEREEAEYLARGRYERQERGEPAVYRNGYEAGRLVMGRGRSRSSDCRCGEGMGRTGAGSGSRWARGARVWSGWWWMMYARGLSTRDIEDIFRGPEAEVLLSRSAVSEITDALWEEYEAFSGRDLSDLPVVYLVVDGVYEAMRRLGRVRDGMLRQLQLLRTQLTEERRAASPRRASTKTTRIA